MENDLEPGAKIIFQWKNPAEKRQRIINNEAEEYAVEDSKDANSGIIIYGRYGPAWQANPWSARALVKQLLSQLASAQGEVERLRQNNIIPEFVQQLADKNECLCDEGPPYNRCLCCQACGAINEVSRIMGQAEQALKPHD